MLEYIYKTLRGNTNEKNLIILIAIIQEISLFTGCDIVRETGVVSCKKEDEIERIKLNQYYKFETAELKILNVKETGSIKTKPEKTNAKGKFIVAEISLKNISEEDIKYSPISLKLINNCKEYHLDENSFETLQKLISQQISRDKKNSYIRPYNILNPGIVKKSFVVFDVPKELKLNDTKLIVEENEHIQFNLTK